MYLEIRIDEEEYNSEKYDLTPYANIKDDPRKILIRASEDFFHEISRMGGGHLFPLADKGILILGEDAAKRAHFIFREGTPPDYADRGIFRKD